MTIARPPKRSGRHRRVLGSASLPLLLLGPVVAVLGACITGGADRLRERDMAEARAAFEANLVAIRDRDVEGYLAGYLDSPDFVYFGPEGVSRGFAPFAAARRRAPEFPDSLVTGPAELTWLAPGVVHVAYPFAARQGPVAGSGWSERVLVRTGEGWRIAVTGVVPAGPETRGDAEARGGTR